jgi:hypothetical protein
MMKSRDAGGDDGVELLLRSEVIQPCCSCEVATFCACDEMGFNQFWKAGNVFFRDPEKEAIPGNVWGEWVIVGDEDRGDTSLHYLKKTNTAAAGSPRTENKVGGGEGIGVALLAFFATGLVDIPMVIAARVLYKAVGAVEI